MKWIILPLLIIVLTGCVGRVVRDCDECTGKETCIETDSIIPSVSCVKTELWSGRIVEDEIEVDVEVELSPCMDYDNLNYTTLNISRDDFEKLACYRQYDWLRGWCYPADCNAPNPPVCTATYMVYCYNPDSPETKYFNNIYLKESGNYGALNFSIGEIE